ncbi:MAG: sigma 54-interacting transcriptional regulator [Thermoguttaceae bacterium]|nr:sigma 54-interacting transcriptional regulator [Thermoguttaceae bacterium]
MSVFAPPDAFFSANRPFFLVDVFPPSALERAEIAAASELPVFISGERGLGKATLARLIAAASERSEAPFVAVRCDRLSPRQAASLLTVRSEDASNSALYATSANDANAATVALDDVWAEAVGGGVLYWAEVDALPARAQRRLATLLAENAAPFRSILGSSRSFAEAVRDGAFVPELKAILTAFPILLPSLAARRDEIATLLPHFLRDAARRLGVLPLVPNERDLEIAAKIHFRQNLRDLRRYAELATLQGDFPRTLGAADASSANVALDEKRQTGENAQTLTPKRRAEEDEPALTKENFPTLDAAAKAHVVAALRLTGGIVEGPSGAAALLAINPHTLRARMRKLGLDWAKIRDESR